jgi:2'-5' RNA ligase
MLNAEDSKMLSSMKADLDPLFATWWNCQLRWVQPQKLHITWLFLGDCDEAQESAIRTTLEGRCPHLESGEIHYSKMDFIGPKNRPNAMVLHATKIPDQYTQFAASLRNELGKFCKRDEDLGFLPHITMFRLPRDHHGQIHIKEELNPSSYLPYIQTIDKISLIESHYGRGRSDYQELSTFKLK